MVTAGHLASSGVYTNSTCTVGQDIFTVEHFLGRLTSMYMYYRYYSRILFSGSAHGGPICFPGRTDAKSLEVRSQDICFRHDDSLVERVAVNSQFDNASRRRHHMGIIFLRLGVNRENCENFMSANTSSPTIHGVLCATAHIPCTKTL